MSTSSKCVIYVNGSYERDLKKLVEGVIKSDTDYTHMIFAFWINEGIGAVDAGKIWQESNQIDEVLDMLHSNGIKAMISGGGGEYNGERLLPITNNPGGGAEYGKALAEFAKKYKFDGMDFDIEDTDSLSAGIATEWLVEATKAAKEIYPEAIISHAPQAPYFDEGFRSNYIQVEEKVGDIIDFYSIQFYNQGSYYGSYDTYENLFIKAGGGTALNQIVEKSKNKDDLMSKLIVGKIVDQNAGSTGYVEPDKFAEILSEGVKNGMTPGGVMGWQWLSDENSFQGKWSTIVSKGFNK